MRDARRSTVVQAKVRGNIYIHSVVKHLGGESQRTGLVYMY